MKDDEQCCPNCGHEVLAWDVMCPGCSEVPWETAAGQRVVRARRLRNFWLTSGPLLALIVLAGSFVVVGHIHMGRTLRAEQKTGTLSDLMQQGAWLTSMLEDTGRWSPRREEFEAAMRHWLDADLPQVLGIIRDDDLPPVRRSKAILRLGHLFNRLDLFPEIASEGRAEVIRALGPLLSESDELLRSSAFTALRMMGASDALADEIRTW